MYGYLLSEIVHERNKSFMFHISGSVKLKDILNYEVCYLKGTVSIITNFINKGFLVTANLTQYI